MSVTAPRRLVIGLCTSLIAGGVLQATATFTASPARGASAGTVPTSQLALVTSGFSGPGYLWAIATASGAIVGLSL